MKRNFTKKIFSFLGLLLTINSLFLLKPKIVKAAATNVQRVDTHISPAATTGTITITSATAGNLIIAAIAIDKTSGTVTVPTGFTRIGTDYDSASVSFALAYKVAAG